MSNLGLGMRVMIDPSIGSMRISYAQKWTGGNLSTIFQVVDIDPPRARENANLVEVKSGDKARGVLPSNWLCPA